MGVRLGSIAHLAQRGIAAIPVQEGVRRFLQLALQDPASSRWSLPRGWPISTPCNWPLTLCPGPPVFWNGFFPIPRMWRLSCAPS